MSFTVLRQEAFQTTIDALEVLRTEVDNNKTISVTQAGIATTKAGEAATSATNAGNSETAAAGSASAAATSATNAGNSETAAAGSASSAATSATNAGNSASAASTSASNAAGSATAAESAKTASETARDKSQAWAETVEDTPVETGKFSSLHHAAKAEADRILAQTAATDAGSAKDIAEAYANYKGVWSSLTGALNIPSSVFHSGTFWMLLTNVADVTLSEPSGANTDWAPIGASVTSVNGKTGEVVIEIADISGLQDALDAKVARGEFTTATAKTDFTDTDSFLRWDSVSSALRKFTWANLKTALASVFVSFTSYTGATAKTTFDDADSFLRADSADSNTVKKFTWANLITALRSIFAPIQDTDTWVLTTLFTGSANPITTNLARFTHTDYIGTGMTQASGVFTFPRTGIWNVKFVMYAQTTSLLFFGSSIRVITDASGTPVITNRADLFDEVNGDGFCISELNGLEVTATADIKVQFTVTAESTGVTTIGNTSVFRTGMIFTRIGDL